MDIHFDPNSPWVGKEAHVTTDWVATADRQLTLDPLDHVGLMDIELTPGTLDAQEISQVQVELNYTDAANEFSAQRTFVLTPGQPVPIGNCGSRTHAPDLPVPADLLPQGRLRYQTDWQTSESPSLVVNDPFQARSSSGWCRCWMRRRWSRRREPQYVEA